VHVLNTLVRKSYDLLSLTKPTMQQCFHPRAKHLLHRYVTPTFAANFFRVNEGEIFYFCQFTVVHFGFCLISNTFRVVMQVELLE